MIEFLFDAVVQGVGEAILYFLPVSEKSKEKVRIYGSLGLIAIVIIVLLFLIYLF